LDYASDIDPVERLDTKLEIRMQLARYARVSPDYYEHRPVSVMYADYRKLIDLMQREGSLRRLGEET
jgi:hypothetical protein